MEQTPQQVVRELNDEINSGTHSFLIFKSDGIVDAIEFMGEQIWNDDNDERLYTNYTIEPLEQFVRREVMELVNVISKIKL
jgi:hypothetical protein